MKFLETKERIEILLSISDQLWHDYKSGLLMADEYLTKADEIRNEFNNISEVTFLDMQALSRDFGYLLLRSKSIFSNKKQYKFQRLVFN